MKIQILHISHEGQTLQDKLAVNGKIVFTGSSGVVRDLARDLMEALFVDTIGTLCVPPLVVQEFVNSSFGGGIYSQPLTVLEKWLKDRL